MRIEFDGGSVKRLVNVWRESWPLPGEKSPRRVGVDSYGLTAARTVAAVPIIDAGRWQQFVIDAGTDGDKLLDLLREGPVKVRHLGDTWIVDLNRIERP